ncbi:MAG: hypothetical protein VXX04_06870, partial [Actinomycetota bacterium]|nr:hypothetical protein [Actinomycetota bacterium]
AEQQGGGRFLRPDGEDLPHVPARRKALCGEALAELGFDLASHEVHAAPGQVESTFTSASVRPLRKANAVRRAA